MNNIIEFKALGHVEIFSGTVIAATITDEHGTRSELTDIGARKFFVDVVEADGTHIGMWDGRSYTDAVREAAILSMDFGPVRNLVTGGAA